jgi:hypothetical protein
MRPLAAVERFFERLFERPSARLFHSPLQPIQIQRRLERAMDSGRVDSRDRAYVPNRYTVTLNPADAESFDGGHPRVEDELGEALHVRARARNYRLIARPQVRLRVSKDVPRGDIQVSAEALDRRQLKRIEEHDDRNRGPAGTGLFAPPLASAPAPGMHVAPVVPARIVTTGAAGSSAATSGGVVSKPGIVKAPVGRLPGEDRSVPLRPGFDRGVLVLATAASPPVTPPTGAYIRVNASEGAAQAPANGAPPAAATRAVALVEVRTNGRLVTTKPFEGATLRVGRGRDNELVLADERVSRHHGQLTARRGVLVYADLDSTNGSFLNGTRVHEIVLGSGDVVRLGNSTLTIKSQS